MEKIAIHKSKHSNKVVKFINANIRELCKYCSEDYARKILVAQDGGYLYGAYFTPSGKIRATFI